MKPSSNISKTYIFLDVSLTNEEKNLNILQDTHFGFQPPSERVDCICLRIYSPYANINLQNRLVPETNSFIIFPQILSICQTRCQIRKKSHPFQSDQLTAGDFQELAPRHQDRDGTQQGNATSAPLAIYVILEALPGQGYIVFPFLHPKKGELILPQ